MNIQSRKIEFIQAFLKLDNEEVITRLEKLLMSEQSSKLNPISHEELNERINQSESDFKEGRFKNQSEILAKYKK